MSVKTMLIPKTLRWRLIFWFGFLLAITLTGFGLLILKSERQLAYSRFDEKLGGYAERLAAAVRDIPMSENDGPGGSSHRPPKPPDWDDGDEGRPPPPPNDFGGPSANTQGKETIILKTMEQIGLELDGAEMTVAFGSSGKTLVYPGGTAPYRGLGFFTDDLRAQYTNHEGRRVCFKYTEMKDFVAISSNLNQVEAQLADFRSRMLGMGFGILLIGLGGAWLLLRHSLEPIQRIESVSREVAAGHLQERIGMISPGSELGDLAATLDLTFSRLQNSFEQQRRFIADASHELRTPLAVLIAEIQSALHRDRSHDEYRDALHANLETAQGMKRLTESLLELARLDAGGGSSSRVMFEVCEVVQHCSAKQRELIRQKQIELIYDLTPGLTMFTNPIRLGLVVSNLIENAIHHSHEGARIWIRTWRHEEDSCLEIRDEGTGILPQDLPHIFERFYRGDRARNRAEGRYGLGLAICQSLIQSEGGSIQVDSKFGFGSAFIVTLPTEAVT